MSKYLKDLKTNLKRAILIAGAVMAYSLLPVSYHITLGKTMLQQDLKITAQLALLHYIADSNDTVYIHIDTYGGEVLTIVKFLNAVDQTRAKTVSVNERIALSGGAMIAFATDERKASTYSVYLFHKAGRTTPLGRIIAPDNLYVSVLANKAMERNVYPCLTKDEISRYESGEDVSIDGQELLNRECSGNE